MKTTTLSLLFAVGIVLTACSEAKNEYHQTFFHPLNPNGIELYADEESDTVRIWSLDSWTAKAAASDNQEDWFTISPTKADVPANSGKDVRMDITASVNNTGKVRTGTIAVLSHDQIGTFVVQYPWLNIQNPSAVYNDDSNSIADRKAFFVLSQSAAGGTSKVVFTVYGDGATMTSDSDWAIPQTTTFDKGSHTVNVTIAKNPNKAERRATLTLTSKSVSTVINITQTGNPEGV